LTLDGASSINGMFGFETANITGASPLTLTGDLGADQRVTFTGSFDNELIIGADVQFDGVVDGGDGHDLLRIQSGAAQSRTVLSAQIRSFEDLISEGAGTLALFGEHYGFDSVAVNGGNLEIGTGTVLDAEQGVIFDGADNRLTLRGGAQVHGRVDGGAGNDTLAFFQAPGATRLFSALDQTGFERLETVGGELRIDRDAGFVNGVAIDGGTLNILAGNTLTANVAGGAGKDEVIVGGRIDGNLDLGAGDDALTITGAGAITGTRSGGDGIDTLVFNTGGTTTAPTQWTAAAYSGFERADVAGGVVSFTGTASLTGLSVSGGRLIGQAGSVLSSVETIVVRQGATFGSAGTVNGNIDVRGTLAPGASPGTMTVNGDVNFASGSLLQMEVSSAASDRLDISGKLTIAQGAAMDITGVLSATPGGALDLVVAQGGITGSFTTINKSNTIFGFVATRGNRIQILGAFQSSDAFSVNAQGAIGYANDLLGDGQMVQSFTAALPVLVSASGQSNAGAFERLTPEAYATAQMQTVQTGLAVSETMRNLRASAPIAPGLHGFAQALGQWNRLAGNAAIGASAARSELLGLLGGIGYGFGEGSRLGAFVGTARSTQNIADLGAENRQSGALFGALADLALGGFDVHALVAYDASHAKTRRTAPTGDAITARYGTGGIIGDLSIGYGVDAGALTVTPRVGVTYLQGKRDAFAERTAPFGLTVDRDSAGMLYGDTAVAVSFDLGGIRPYAEAGVRSRLTGDATPVASAHFTAASGTGPLFGFGAATDRTVGRVALGLGAELSGGVRLNLGYTGEYGSKARHNVSGGVAIAF
ncbi:autotransporter outer membrane beta-barrel domain-containing protein, partial [Sphingomonas naasensis]